LNLKLDQKQWELVQRYVTGNAGSEERQAVEGWMAKSHENRRLVQELKQVWNQSPPENFNVDVQHAWEQFSYRNQKKTQPSVPIIGYARKKSKVPVYLFRAAAVLLAALFAGFFVQYQMNLEEQRDAEQASVYNALQELVTEKGEKARVTFSDGTQVMLNSASSVQFPRVFHGSAREVYLDGEAYFEVAYNPDKPFIVHSQDARVEVLGTEFNVRGWIDDPTVEVVVRGGKVSVQSSVRQPDERSEVILTEGLKTELERGQNPLKPQRVDPVHHLLWTSGGMHFDNEPFYRVVRDLERRFNVDITVADSSLLDVPYTGTFQYAELDEVLSVIAASMGVGYDREGMEVHFHL
jgi:transmembrane sensor